MAKSIRPLVAQRVLLAGLVLLMAASALLLWLVGGEERARRELARGEDGAMHPPAAPVLPRAEPEHAPASATPRAHEPERTALAPEALALEPLDEEAFDPGAIPGRVVSLGRPVPDVALLLFSGALERRERRTALAETTSDAEGRFRFRGLVPHQRHALLAQHPEHLPQEVTVYPGHAEELELERAATVGGTVRSAETGELLPGIVVALQRWHFGPAGMAEHLTSTSDAQGRWELRWAEPGIERFLVLRPGLLPERREFQVGPQGGAGYEILLDSARVVELELFDLTSGTLLADTELLSDDVRVRTDARGRLSIPLPPGGAGDESLRVSVALPDGCVTMGRIDPEKAPPLLRLPVARGGTVLGRVLDARGGAVAGALLRVSGGGRAPDGLGLPEGFWLNPARAAARSGADGSFTLQGLPPREGEVEVRAHHPAHPPGRSEPFDFDALGATAEVEVVLARGGTIAGTVRVDGEPAALRVYWEGERAGGWTRANDRGAYRILGVPGGQVVLRARLEDEDEDAPRTEDQIVLVEEGSDLTVDLDLTSRRARIRGRVLDTRGAPVAEAEVVALLQDENEWTGDEPRTESEADGSFELSVPDTPGLVFDVRAESGPRRALAQAVPAGDSNVEIVLPALATLVVRVVDALERTPVLGFQLYWRDSEEGSFERLVQGGRRFSPGPDGTFLAELPAGRLDLAVSARSQGYVPARVDGVDVYEGNRATVELELERGVELVLEFEPGPEGAAALRELQRGRAAIASEEQWAERARGGDWFQQEVRNAQAVRPDAQGVARIEALPSGRYRLFNGPRGTSFRPRDFEVPPVQQHRVRVALQPEQKKKPAGGGD